MTAARPSSVPRRRRRTIALGISLAACSLVAACTSGSSSSTNPNNNNSSNSNAAPGATSAVKTLILAHAVKVDTLDPAQNSVNESIWLDQNLYSRLVAPDPTGTKIVPDLATSWNISKDNLTYTFHPRSAKFSDGSPVTAQDAVWSINRSRNLKGGWGFLLTAVKSVTAPDAKT